MPAWHQLVPISGHVEESETARKLQLYATSIKTSVSTRLYSNYILNLPSGLNNVELAGPATMSLKDIAMECRANLKPYAECILDASQATLMSNTLKVSQ